MSAACQWCHTTARRLVPAYWGGWLCAGCCKVADLNFATGLYTEARRRTWPPMPEGGPR